jgi:hypothetical protein
MGWTETHREPGVSHVEWFNREWRTDRVIALKAVGSTLYGAMRHHDSDEVEGIVILINRRSREWFNFGYKEMSERSGPFSYDAPASILDLLTPTDDAEANKWRAAARAAIAKKAEAKKVAKGSRIRFAAPLKFSDGSTGDTFELIERSTFHRIVFLDFVPAVGSADYRGGRVRIPAWSKRDFTLISA